MRRVRMFAAALACAGWLLSGTAATAERVPRATAPKTLEVFVREGCPHCAEAKVYLPAFARERQHLTIV